VSRHRQNINIELADGAKDQLEAVRQRNGMTQKEMVGRLINWFSDQDEAIQQIILGQIPERVRGAVATHLLDELEREHAPSHARRRAIKQEALMAMADV